MYRILHQPTSLAYYNPFDKKDGKNINNQKKDEKKRQKNVEAWANRFSLVQP